jgi:hypothetical protein
MLCGAPLFAQSVHPTQPAQPAQSSAPSAETTALTDKARELYLEGQKAGAKKRWGEAYANFLAAWSLKRHYQVAGNLGWVEVELGRHREAAEHLAYYLREAPKEKVKERQSVEVLLAEARKHVGALVVNVEPAGAEVFVDGVSVGKAPLVGEVFVDPGQRTITARAEEYSAARQVIEAVKGTSQSVTLSLVVPQAATTSGSTNRSAGEAAAGDVAAGGGARTAGDGAGTTAGASGASKGLIIAGAVTSAFIVGAGVVFAVVANGHAADAEEQSTMAIQEGVRDPCLMAAYGERCEEHKSTLSAGETFTNLSISSFVLGSALGAGTVIYALVSPRSKPNKSVQVAPVVASRGGGLVLSGRW